MSIRSLTLESSRILKTMIVSALFLSEVYNYSSWYILYHFLLFRVTLRRFSWWTFLFIHKILVSSLNYFWNFYPFYIWRFCTTRSWTKLSCTRYVDISACILKWYCDSVLQMRYLIIMAQKMYCFVLKLN